MKAKQFIFFIVLFLSIRGLGQDRRPNILFIIADDISRTSMGAYGCEYIKTPHFDRIANEGVLFTNAYVCNPKCAPSRAGLLTGRYSWQLEEACNHWPAMPEKWVFYPDLLEQAGYFTGYTGKGWAPGLYPGEHNPAGWEYNNIKCTPPYRGISPKDYAGNFEDFLNRNSENQPFSFWLGTHEAHRLFEADVYKKEHKNLDQVTVQKCFPDNELVRADLADYGVEVAYHDKHIGRCLEILEERGLLENTLVIATSDHGMAFPRIKGQIYDEGFHVAFAARWGNKIKPGRVVDDFINFPDVAPTLLEVAGLKAHKQMTGKSFMDLLLSEQSGKIDPSRSFSLLGKERHDLGRTDGDLNSVGYPVRAIRTERYLYAHNYKTARWPAGDPQYGYMNCDKSPTKSYLLGLDEEDPDYNYFLMAFGKRVTDELYDVIADPDCVNNLALNPENSAIVKRLKTKMENALHKQNDPRERGNGDIFDYYPHASPKKQKVLYKDAYYDMQEKFNENYRCENHFEKSWSSVNDRVWIGSEFWSNRLQDWKIQNGRLECVANNSRLLMRTTHLVNCRLASNDADFVMKIDVGALQSTQNDDAACGILIGAGSTLDVWGASLIQQSTGPGGGLFAGITASGILFVKDMEDGKILGSTPSTFSDRNSILVEVSNRESGYFLILKCAGEEVILTGVNKERLTGNIAVVSDPGTGEQPGSFWFNSLEISGKKLQKLEGRFGPIISTQYTLSNQLLKLTAQMAPLGEADPKEVSIEINRDGNWQEISKTKIITPGYTATFRISDWDASLDIPYRVKYLYQSSNNRSETAVWEGTIKHDPIEKEEIVIAGFTGNHNNASPGLSGIGRSFKFDYNGIWYPHIEVLENVRIHEPDVLFFSGDQVYQGNSPTAPDMKNYELDYLYKWYLYCLAYRSLTKDIPTISIPDDHDVYQGNLWGQNGRSTDKDNKGGYVHPAWFVKMVERTQCSNLPDPFDPTPIDQNIGVYYTSLTYGGIGFAVLEDRKFKSGCADNPFVGSGRPDHIVDPEFDVRKIDLPGKKLLGDRQLEFLDDWACDWKDQEMKIALSQTIFANMATHHGAGLNRVFGDLDSNGWPQTGRDKALDALRKGFVFHMAGDQHLASIVHHGIEKWDDAIYSFCVPSVANFYPRAWWPEKIGADREKGAPQNMGRHRDGFGNLVTVYGVANPVKFTKKSTNHDPLILHDRMPGYGIVKMNKRNRTITMECWPRYADPDNDTQQYEGWPKTVSQFENYGRKAYAYLPTISVEGTEDPVVEIRDEQGGALVYCVRIAGREFKPKVFKQSSYKVTIKDTEKEIVKVLEGVLPDESSDSVFTVRF